MVQTSLQGLARPTCKACTSGRPRGGSGGRAEEDLPLNLRDRLRDANLARAGLRAVEDLAAAPGAGAFVQDRQPLGGAAVARVEDEAVRVDEGGGADELV